MECWGRFSESMSVDLPQSGAVFARIATPFVRLCAAVLVLWYARSIGQLTSPCQTISAREDYGSRAHTRFLLVGTGQFRHQPMALDLADHRQSASVRHLARGNWCRGGKHRLSRFREIAQFVRRTVSTPHQRHTLVA